MSRLAALLCAALLCGCAAPAVVTVAPNYSDTTVRKVALARFTDFPSAPGSGDVVATTFEKYLMWAGYSVIDARTGGPDGVVYGTVTDYTAPGSQTVMVDVPQEQTDPVYGTVVTRQRTDQGEVRNVQHVVTGYATTTTDTIVPETQTTPAHVALSVKLVAVDNGEILWEGSADSDGVDLNAAAEQASAKLMQAVVKQLKKKQR